MVEVDLELARAELVIGRGHLQLGVAHVAQHREQDALGVALATDDVDVAGLIGVPLPAAVARVVGLAHVELELGPDDGGQSELGQSFRHVACDLTR